MVTTESPFLDGPQLFARYAFMPNRLTYCGGDDHGALFDYCVAGITDRGLHSLLRKFTGAMPYLRLIAECNAILDPFDARVVEAYWLGNELLQGVEAHALYDSLRARFGGQMRARDLELVLGKAPAGAHPHHSFHVLEVCPRNGWPQPLSFMDNCRISWGKVVALDGSTLAVEGMSLVIADHQLVLGCRNVTLSTGNLMGKDSSVQPGPVIGFPYTGAGHVRCFRCGRSPISNDGLAIISTS
jgi:Family of unknown function (DUF6390)